MWKNFVDQEKTVTSLYYQVMSGVWLIIDDTHLEATEKACEKCIC